jgi:hypothetical protein
MAKDESNGTLGKSVVSLVIVFGSMSALYTIQAQRLDSFEANVKRAADVDKSERTEIWNALRWHEGLVGHPGVLAKNAELAQKFVEVETQFLWKDELAKASLANLHLRIEKIESIQATRVEWFNRIAVLEEKVRSLEHKP